MRCKNLVVADSEIVKPRGRSILSRVDLMSGTNLYKRTIFGNYRDIEDSTIVLKPKKFVDNPRRKVLGMLGMTGEYNLTNIRPYAEEFGLDSNRCVRKSMIKKLFKNKYPASKDRRIVPISFDSM